MAQTSISPFVKQSALNLPYRVTVLAGGDSSEREVSLKSGQAVATALASRGHLVKMLDPAEVDMESRCWADTNVVFIALHGRFGEDGQVQSILDRIGLPYTGSGASASRLGISKSATKERFLRLGIPTAEYSLIHSQDHIESILAEAELIGYPLVVKPDTQGSSLGVFLVHSPEELSHALPRVFELDPCAILERAILGSEWTVGLLDDFVFPPINIVTNRNIFDFEAKYLSNETQYLFDFDGPPQLFGTIQSVAQDACRAIGTRGVARVDIMLDETRKPWVLEINTIPGFTDHSLVPKSAARIGWSFDDLCERALLSAFSAKQTATTHRPLDKAS